MKKSLPFILAALALSSSSCSQSSEDESNFKILYPSSKEYVLPGGTASCQAIGNSMQSNPPVAPVQDIQALYFTIRNPQIYWYDKKKSMNVSLITVTIDSPSIDQSHYSCTIGGDELGALFSTAGVQAVTVNGTTTYVPYIDVWDGSMLPDTIKDTSKSICTAIKCGGIKLKTGITKFSATAYVKVQGIATDTDGSQTPVYIQNTLSVQN